MSLLVRAAGLNDWPQLKELHARLQTDKACNYLASSLEELEAFLVNSLTFPQITLLVVEWDRSEFEEGKYLVGLAAMMLIQSPQLGQMGVYVKPTTHCFIHAAYIPSWIWTCDLYTGRWGTQVRKTRVPLHHGVDAGGSTQDAGALLWNSMVSWAQTHGSTYIYGNVRLDGNFGAFEKKYGLTKRHIVIGKELNPHG